MSSTLESPHDHNSMQSLLASGTMQRLRPRYYSNENRTNGSSVGKMVFPRSRSGPSPFSRRESSIKRSMAWPRPMVAVAAAITISPHLKSPGGPRDCINSLDRIQNTGRRVYTDAAACRCWMWMYCLLGSFLALA